MDPATEIRRLQGLIDDANTSREERVLLLRQQTAWVERLPPVQTGGLRNVVLSTASSSVYCDSVLQDLDIEYLSIPKFEANPNEAGTAIDIPKPENDKKWENEYEFNNAMAPIFLELFGDRLYNSELCKWLEASDDPTQDLKPDWFLLDGVPELVDKKTVDNNKFKNEFVQYGSPKRNCSRIVEKILEGKLGHKRLSKTDIGVLFKYIRTLVNVVGHPFPGGVVYNEKEFLYAEVDNNGGFCGILRCDWKTEGSKELLVDRLGRGINTSVTSVLRHLKQSQNFEIKSCLGYGRYGCVFHVSRNEGDHVKTYAVKVVVPMSNAFRSEFLTLLANYDKASDVVVEPVRDSFTEVKHDDVCYGGFYIMNEVGSGAGLLARSVYTALQNLHSFDIVHGDARVSNAILVDEAVKWIDFRRGDEPVSFAKDIRTLTQSFLPQALKDERFANAVEDYLENRTHDNMMRVYESVKLVK